MSSVFFSLQIVMLCYDYYYFYFLREKSNTVTYTQSTYGCMDLTLNSTRPVLPVFLITYCKKGASVLCLFV